MRAELWIRGGLLSTLVLVAACPDPKGNDPNVPDRVPDGADVVSRAAQCPPALPTSCPQTPSYSTEIAPLVQRTCLPCHSSGGVAADRDLSNYRNLVRLETTNLVQVNGCIMPPPDAGADAALSLDERVELLQWFVCGSPNN
jgi:hypothetical protein